MYFFSLVTLQKARTHGLLAEVYRIIANDLRVWGGGGEGGGLWGWITKYSGGIKGGSVVANKVYRGRGAIENWLQINCQ